jgi:ABC-type transport system involved in multi-copper enzyme maturation permease subunit
VTRVAQIQHRAAFITVFATLVALVIVTVVGHNAVSASYAAYLAAGCTLAHPTNLGVCANTANSFADVPTFTPIVIALRLFPVIVGSFVGAPLIAREMESGTFRLAWTQGVGRTRLILGTLATLALVVVPVTIALGLLFGGWYVHPYEVINVGVGNHWQASLFMTTWWTATASVLFALALGALVGALVKRTVAAIASTAAVSCGVLLVLGQLLPRVLSIGTVVSSHIFLNGMEPGAIDQSATAGQGPAGGWLVRSWYTGSHGQVLGARAGERVGARVDRAYELKDGSNSATSATRWLTQHHDTYWVAYQPADHFWMLQAVVGLVLLVLAALCVAAVLRCVEVRRRRPAMELDADS